MVAILACAGGYYGYGESQKKAVMTALSSEYGYTIPPYKIDISLAPPFKKATATISATHSVSPTQTWDIKLEKSDSLGWGISSEQRAADRSEFNLFDSLANHAIASAPSMNAAIPNDVKLVYLVIKYKYPKYKL
jgi:hypothetical protein